jgi:hypothetical protein
LIRTDELAHELPAAGQQAAEILRPGAIDRAVKDYVADLAGTQFLRLGRKAEECVDPLLGEQLHRLDQWIRDPVDVLARIEPHTRRHDGDELVPEVVRAETLDTDLLPL